jgi:hypothetical protein
MHTVSQSRKHESELSPLLLALQHYRLILCDAHELSSGVESLIVEIGYIAKLIKFDARASNPQNHHNDDECEHDTHPAAHREGGLGHVVTGGETVRDSQVGGRVVPSCIGCHTYIVRIQLFHVCFVALTGHAETHT